MGFDADEEILQDFLIEAGEILELLSEQLVDLEQNPNDSDLLNAIFRGFHTIKGGAGFLQLDALVGCCHVAENVFDILRNGKRKVDSELMDVILRVLDSVNDMFEEVRNGQDPTAADPQLIADLEKFAKPEDEKASVTESPATVQQETTPVSEDAVSDDSESDITDEEFENLLDALETPQQSEASSDLSESVQEVNSAESTEAVTSKTEDAGNDISDDEFEQLLNELHGEGQPIKADATADSEDEASSSGDIKDDEFEQLLDDLHGKGQFDSKSVAEATTESIPVAPEAKAKSGSEKETEPEKEIAPKSVESVKPKKDEPVPKLAAVKSKPEQKPKPKVKSAGKRSDGVVTETTVRVDTRRLDDIMNMVGELVLVRNRLKRLGENSGSEAMQKAVTNLDVVTGDLQSAVMQTRMQPIKKVFGRFPRVVRDLARSMKKEINLELVGEETDLDKNLVEALSDPLVHLVRNAVDHGIESPEKREAAGKPRIGKVVLSAHQEGDHILLSIDDDGAGMDANVLRKIAVDKGLYDEDSADRLSDTECYNLIFAPGFSTKKEISDVSGRGVGMDVVKTKINQLNGTVTIDSTIGKGSKLIIKVPLTLAIMPTLMVKLADQAFAFPLASVVEIFHLDLTKTNIVDGQECVVVRDNVYPLFYIKKWLIKAGITDSSDSAHVVIVAVGTKRVGFIVDQLVGQEEVVIKPLGGMLHGTPGMAGATITGDGRIALILDVPSLLQRYA